MSQWSEREARFDNLQSRMRVHQLIEEGFQMTGLSRLDALTGASSRRVLEDVSAGSLIPLSAVFVDVDDVEDVNDSFSHVVGDQVLVQLDQLVQPLRPASRTEDRLVRYGRADPRSSRLAHRGLGRGIRESRGWARAADPRRGPDPRRNRARPRARDHASVSVALYEAEESGRDHLVIGVRTPV